MLKNEEELQELVKKVTDDFATLMKMNLTRNQRRIYVNC